jgi:hypothetical protein
MANEKISDLPAGAPAQPTDLIPIARLGANYNLQAQQIAQLASTLGNLNVEVTGNTSGVTTIISSGTVILAGGNNITLSQNGQSITISGGQSGLDVTLGGNTAGVLALVSSGTLFLAGGNNVTLSQNGQSVTISANTVAAANLSVSAGTTSGAFGGVTFANAGNVSFGLNNGTITATASYLTTAAYYFSGNTTGQSSSSTANDQSLTISAAGIISGGWSNGSWVLSATSAAQTVQTQNLHDVSLSGNTAGVLALVSSGTLIIAGGNNITLSQNGQSVTISGANVGGAQTGISGIVVSNTTYTSGTVTLQNANGISFGSSGANGVSASYTVPTQASLFALGNTTQNSSTVLPFNALSFNGLGEVSVGYLNGSIQVSAPPSSIGVSTGGGTSGNTGTFSGQVVFAGGNNITLSVSTAAGGAQTITISGANAGGAQTGISGIVVSNTTYTSGTVTFQNANGISFGSSGANGISASYTVPVQTNQTIGVYASSQTTGQSSSSTVDARSFTHVGQGIISVGLSGGSLLFSATTVAQTNQTIGLYASSQTTAQSSSSTVDARSITFVGAGNVSVGLSGGSYIISGATAAGITTGGGYAAGNTTGQSSSSTYAISSLNVSFAGLMSGGWSASTLIISAPNTTSIAQLSFFQPLGQAQNTTVTQNGNGSIQLYPAVQPVPFSASRADIIASVSAAALAASTQAQTVSMFIGLYSLNGSTLSLASSGSQSYAFTNSSNNSNASITGIRRFSCPINVNYTGGFDLFVGVMTNTTFVNTNGISLSNVVVPIGPSPQLQGLIGQVPSNSMQFVPGQGFFSTTSAGLPNSMALSAISGAGSNGSNVDYYSPVQFANVTA